ncbi:MAG: hypothetical protein M1150_04725 [Patescibacteria group bacterium]|nr:hypothetical protein [Patescibacteria group bacterium]
MKRFLPIIVLTLVAWGVFAYTLFQTSPLDGDQLITVNVAYFLGSFWLGVAGLASLLIYFPQRLFDKEHPKVVFRRGLRRGMIFATVLTGIGILQIIKAGNVLNNALVAAIGFLLEIYWSSK